MALPYKGSGIYINYHSPSSGGIDEKNGQFTALIIVVFKIKFVKRAIPHFTKKSC